MKGLGSKATLDYFHLNLNSNVFETTIALLGILCCLKIVKF